MSSQGLYQHTRPPDRKFPDFSACRLHRQLVQKMKARSGLHDVPRPHAMAAEELASGHRLLARDLDDQESDGGLRRRRQGVGVGFEDRAGRAFSWHSTGRVRWTISRIGPLEAGSLETQVVEAIGQGCMARTRLWTAGAGSDQSMMPSSLRSLGARVTFDLS